MIRTIIAIIFLIILLYLYNKYVVIIWYYIKDNNGNYVRTYNKLLTI